MHFDIISVGIHIVTGHELISVKNEWKDGRYITSTI